MSAAEDNGGIEIDPQRVQDLIGDGVQVVDVREPYERDAGHIAGSLHIPLAQLTEQAQSIERDRPVVFYCRVGARSLMAAQAFRASSYQAYTMAGGLVRWAGEGRALAPDGGHVAEH